MRGSRKVFPKGNFFVGGWGGGGVGGVGGDLWFCLFFVILLVNLKV